MSDASSRISAFVKVYTTSYSQRRIVRAPQEAINSGLVDAELKGNLSSKWKFAEFSDQETHANDRIFPKLCAA